MSGTATRGRPVARISALIYVLQLLYFGLTPFVFLPENRAQWNSLESALDFDGQGIAYSQGWAEIGPSSDHRVGIHIIAESKALPTPTAGLGTLLCLDDGQKLPLVLLAQWADWLIVRVRSDQGDLTRGYWEIGQRGVLEPGVAHLISLISSDGSGTDLYVDGQLLKHSTRPISTLSADRPFRLVLGSNSSGRAGWSGLLRSIFIQTATTRPIGGAGSTKVGPIDFDFSALFQETHGLGAYALDISPTVNSSGDLLILNQIDNARLGNIVVPKTFAPLTRSILSFPDRDSSKKSWFRKDAARNFLGFIPLGVLLMLGWGPRSRENRGTNALVFSILFGVCLSLTIELIQVYQPSRFSTLLDLTWNAMGCAAGATCALIAQRVLWNRTAQT